MTAEMLMALMLTMKCHTLVVDIPERRETLAQTVCVRVQPVADTSVAEKKQPVVVKKKAKKKKYRKKRRRK